MDHTSTLLLNESIHITPQQVCHLLISHERQKIPLHEHPLLCELFTISNGSYSYTYPLGIEHAGTVEKDRDSDRERGQGQPEARASLEKVEKEVKKTSHLEKFEARDPNGNHRDYILLLFVGLARKSTIVCFLFSF